MTPAALISARNALGWSRAQMRAYLGRSERRYRGYENGEYPIPPWLEQLVANALKEMGE